MTDPMTKTRRSFAGHQVHPDRSGVPPRWLGGQGARQRLDQMQRELDEIARKD